MVAEPFGGWVAETQQAFKTRARAGAARSGLGYSAVLAQMYESLSIKIARGVARALLARVSEASAASAETPAVTRAASALAASVVA